PRDRQHVVLELDLHVLLAHPGQVGPQDEMVILLDQVHRRGPAARRAVVAGSGLRIEERAEQPAPVLLERLQLPDGLPSYKCHRLPPMIGTIAWSHYKTYVEAYQVSSGAPSAAS